MADMVPEETRLRLVLETIPLPAFVASFEGDIEYANQALRSVSGLKNDRPQGPRTLFGLGIFHNFAEYRGFLQSFRHGGNTRRLALPADRLGVGKRPLVLYASRVSYGAGQALCGVIAHHSAKTHLLGEAGEQKESSDRLLDKLGCFAMRIDPKGRVRYANAPLLVELGYDREERPATVAAIDVETSDTDLISHIERAFSHGAVTYETSFQRTDGTLFPVAITLRALRRPGFAKELLLTAIDLTAQRRAQHDGQLAALENIRLKKELSRSSALIAQRTELERRHRIISASPAFEQIEKQIDQVAPTDTTVLITGETGTGKELIARAIHARSQRAAQPLLILNCGALPAELIESELFGYRKGAFTGADRDHVGRFELADGGTLFLDEIGEMPMLLQTRLLRVLQDGAFTPVGARAPVTTNVRIVAATNRDLDQEVNDGNFRSDLYFRLNIFPIHSPPLRERPEDIPALVEHFIHKHGATRGAEPLPMIAPADLERLRRHPFEGNVRELENIIQRALIVSPPGKRLVLPALDGVGKVTAPASALKNPITATANGRVPTFEEIQRHHIEHVLERTEGKVSGPGGAAELLDMNPQTLFSKMRKLGIKRRGKVRPT